MQDTRLNFAGHLKKLHDIHWEIVMKFVHVHVCKLLFLAVFKLSLERTLTRPSFTKYYFLPIRATLANVYVCGVYAANGWGWPCLEALAHLKCGTIIPPCGTAGQ